MANVKTQGTQAFTVIDGQVFRFVCIKKIGFGQDSFGKIDVTCLEAESKKYLRGMRDPGEGSFDIDYDDENASHDKLAELAEKGAELDWYIGSSHSKTPPTYNAATNEIDLPDDRMWLSFKGYVNDAAPNDIEVDAALGYSYTLVRTSKVTKAKRTVTP